MTISTAIADSFKFELLSGVHNLSTDTIKLALFVEPAPLSAATTIYSTTGEVTGTGYVAGGKVVTGVQITQTGNTSFIDFDNVEWTSATFTTDGCLLYNASRSNKAIASWKFNTSVEVVEGKLIVIPPTAGASTAVVRITS